MRSKFYYKLSGARDKSIVSIRLVFLVLILIGLKTNLFSQETLTKTGKREITGVIKSIEGLTLPGVSIVIKGTTIGAISDNNGKFTLAISGNDSIIVISSIGYLSEEIVVVDQTDFQITLIEDITEIGEVIVVGYGTQKKKEVTGAVAQVSNEILSQSTTPDLGIALQGQIAGVTVMASSGQPGSSSNIQIRGLSSVIGANAPLYVVDGIPYERDPRLSINEIETIDVLKDAASAAIYGTRGSGGVILITTKKGKAGAMKVDMDFNYGIQKITSGVPLMNFEESLYTMQLIRLNNEGTAMGHAWTPLETDRYMFFNDSRMIDVVENDYAPVQNYSLTMSGGKEDLLYSIIANYTDQEGLLINSGYDRFNIRTNMSLERGKWSFKTGLGILMDGQAYEPWQILLQTYKYKPYQQEIDPDMETIQNGGIPGSSETTNLSAMTAMLKQTDVRNGHKTDMFFQVDYNIVKDLTIATRIGGSYGNDKRVRINPLFKAYDDEGELIPMIQRSGIYNSSSESSNFIWESNLNYGKQIGDHSIKLLGVYSMESYSYSSFFGEKFDLVNNDVTVINGATLDANAGSGIDWNQDRTNSLIGMLGRVQYDYQEKYLLSASIRRDGSSRFSEKYRWGIFPSVSVGWNISDEGFWDVLPTAFHTLKIRASYGTTGNQNFLDYSNAATISLGNDYVFGPETGDNMALGAIQTGYANKNVKWETTVQSNVGFDLSFFENKLTFTGDLYNSNKVDMLFPLILPPSTGAGRDGTVILNVGDMNNKGIELATNYRHSGRFSWNAGLTFSKNKNEITKMSGSNKIAYLAGGTAVDGIANPDRITVIREGYEAGAFFLVPTDGVLNTEEELEEYRKLVPTARIGDLKYVNTNGDEIIDDNDRIYYGSGAPEFVIGLNFGCDYRGFDLSMQWYGSYGNKVVNSSKTYSYMYETHKDLVYQWSPNNPDSEIPAFRGFTHENYRGYSDYWIEDGSFIRLRNISLGYTLPKAFASKIKAGKLRVYLTAQNPITITKYTGFDPEVGNDGLQSRGIDKGNYPIGSQYRIGVQINF
ncbi:MAG: TonB-dependent receptor [Bacteroidales bacterium]|nr:TonB-dependent receptor [Bacteroidales bacterium]